MFLTSFLIVNYINLSISIDHLAQKIRIDVKTAEISVQSAVSPGIYSFYVIARNPTNNANGRALVRLTVTTVNQCGDKYQVDSSLIIHNLIENKGHEIMDVTVVQDCEYSVFHVEPESLSNIFSIENNMLTSKAFDREGIEFIDMALPQFQMTLKLSCPEIVNKGKISSKSFQNSTNNPLIQSTSKSITTLQQRADDVRQYILTENIKHLWDTTMLTIIIEDENDNDPIFVNPAANVLLGFPEPKVAEKILVPFLITLYVCISE